MNVYITLSVVVIGEAGVAARDAACAFWRALSENKRSHRHFPKAAREISSMAAT